MRPITKTVSDDPLLARLEFASAEVTRARQALDEAHERRDTIVLEGLANGYSRQLLALHASLTPTRITHIAAA